MKKIILSAILTLSLVAPFSPSPAKAADDVNRLSIDINTTNADNTQYISYTYHLQGKVMNGEFQGFMYNNKLYVYFNSLQQFPMIKKVLYVNDDINKFESHADVELIDGSKITLSTPYDAAPQVTDSKGENLSTEQLITDDMTPGMIGHLPLRVIMELLGYVVKYNSTNHTVVIEKP